MDQNDLKELNDIFKDMGGVEKVDNFTNNFEELEDGTYLGEIEKVSIKTSRTSGKPMIEIIVALEQNRKEYIYLMLAGNDLKKTQFLIARAVTQLKKLGVTGVELEDFLRNAIELTGTKVNLEIKTNGSFKSKYLTLA